MATLKVSGEIVTKEVFFAVPGAGCETNTGRL